MSDARYYGISLELDPMGQPGAYKLTFSTMPGMSTSVTDLRMGDLDALARILGDRNDGLAVVEAIVAAPRPQVPGEPCPHCGGAGSAHANACDPD